MIFIKRTNEPKMNENLFKEKQRLDDYIDYATDDMNYSSNNELRISRRFYNKDIKSLDFYWYEELVNMFKGKCAYCETYVGTNGIVDHFRPVENVIDEIQNEFYYIWLAYEWSNLYLSCKNCSISKSNYFPVETERAQVFGDIKHEKPLLVDPCTDSPQDHLFFTNEGYISPKTKKGKVTIEILNLNREELVNERSRRLNEIGFLLNQTNLIQINNLTRLHEIYNLQSDYLALSKQTLADWINNLNINSKRNVFKSDKWKTLLRQTFGEFNSQVQFMDKNHSYIDKKDWGQNNDLNFEKYRRTVIEEIEVNNVRGISFKHKFRVDKKQAPWLMLLGENGTGKTSVLQSIALTLLKNWTSLGVNGKSFVNKNEECSVKVKLAGEKNCIQLLFHADGDIARAHVEYEIPIIAYGAVRLIPKKNKKKSDIQNMNVRNLFATSSNAYFLQNPSSWLTDKNLIQSVSKVILDVLPFPKEEKISMAVDEAKNFYLIRDGKRIDLHELSSGYQSIIAITVDIMRSIYSSSNSDGQGQLAEGIVLIDEIDAHLHPTWKMRIVSQLRTAFPRMQFIVTSHDPLCLRGVTGEEIAVMKRVGNISSVIKEVPDPKGLGIDEILTSGLFNMESTIDPEVDKLIQEYHKLLNSNVELEEEQDIKKIENRLEQPDIKYFGYTIREKLMYRAIDRFISNKKMNSEPYHTLDEDTENELLKLWNMMEIDTDD